MTADHKAPIAKPLTATGRKVVVMHGVSLLDDVLGIEAEAAAAERERIAALAEAARRVGDAITDEGGYPEYHRLVMARARKELPTLMAAIDALREALEAHDDQ